MLLHGTKFKIHMWKEQTELVTNFYNQQGNPAKE